MSTTATATRERPMYKIDGLDFIVSDVATKTLFGVLPVRYVNVVPANEPMPTAIIASFMLIPLAHGKWVLGHILIEDDARGCGLAEAILLEIEREHGHVSAIWCSARGEAFAKKFVAKHGARPSWQIGGYSDDEMAAGMARLERMMKASVAQ